MAIFNLHMSSAKGRSVVRKFNYNTREEEYSYEIDDKYDDFIYAEHVNMPVFAQNNPNEFWKSVEEYERINANTFREIELSIPNELNDEERIEVVNEFAKKIFKDEYVYSLAIHNKKSSVDDVDNIHCHIIFSERKLDGIERDKEQFFKRYNSKNRSNGGCQKVDWSRKAKLYEIREEWERTANSYLKKYNTEISCKSLKDQRINAIMEGNYLKAEMLDRRAVNIDFQLYKYCYNSEIRENNIKYFESAKRVKEYKEKLYKLRCKNFEEENEKAKQRILNDEREEIDFSRFDIQEFDENKYNEINNQINLYIDNNVEILQNNRKIKELSSLSEIEIEEKAFNIITKNTYLDKLNRLNELDFIYDKTNNKDKFIFKNEKAELEQYFSDLKSDKLLQINLIKVKEEIEENNRNEIELLKERNSKLENNSLVYENSIELKKILQEKLDSLILDYKKLNEIRDNMYQITSNELNEERILFNIYKNMNREDLIEKYRELKEWKEQLTKITDESSKEELQKKINAREGGFAKFNYENNINQQLDLIIEDNMKKYEGLKNQEVTLENKIKISNSLISQYSDFIVDEINDNHKQIVEDFNYENIFKTSVDINILIDKKESRIKQIMSISEDEINSRAYNILTKNEYSKNKKELEELNLIYDKVINKEKFMYKSKKEELENYFDKIHNNEYFQNKLSKMKENIRDKYQAEKDKLGVELKELRYSEYKDLYKENTNESFILSKELIKETYTNLSELYNKSKEIDKKVNNYKLRMLDKEEILLEVYKQLDKENIVEKYRELKEWKEQLTKITDESLKEELQKKINAREGGFAKFNYENNILASVDEILNERRKIYKELRQEQDDIKGRIKYSKDLLSKLKDKQKDELIYENNLLKEDFIEIKELDEKEDISSIEKLYHKLIYNCKVEDNESIIQSKVNISLENSDNKFDFILNETEKIELRKIIVENINKLVEENNEIQKDTNLKILEDDKELIKYILDKKTDNQYSLELSRIDFYNEQINKKIDIKFYQNAIEQTQDRINTILKNNIISDEEKSNIRANIRSKSISNITKLHSNKKNIRILYSALKDLNSSKHISLSSLLISNKKDDNMPEKYNYDKKLYVLGVDRIVIEEEDIVEKERRRILWENSR